MDRLRVNLKKARGMPAMDLAKKASYKIKNGCHYLWRKSVVSAGRADMDANHFDGFSPSMTFLFDASNKERYIGEMESLGIQGQVIEKADRVCNHTFSLLGVEEIDAGADMTWNVDFRSGFVWENKFFMDIVTVDLGNDAEVKMPWELSRFAHISVLGQAYMLSGDGKYAIEFKRQIEDWILKNPPEMSVNWTCAMEAAIRACSWIVGYYYFKDCGHIEAEFWKEFNKELYIHALFIARNIENTQKFNTNHYLADLVGLVWTGLYFDGLDTKKGTQHHKKWLKFGLERLEEEMKVQINSDGTDYEASTAYHCFVAQMLLYTRILCGKNGIRFSEEFEARLEGMFEFIMNIIKPSGLISLIGDMDSGRFMALGGYEAKENRDFRSLLHAAGEYFDRDDFRIHAGGKMEEAIWLFEDTRQAPAGPKALNSASYPEGGFHILRNESFYLIARCGKNGTRGTGGHTHNDQLSFELSFDGLDFIVDPGCYAYTSDYNMRNLFRSTRCHNTVYVEGHEQNSFDELRLFELNDETDAKAVAFGEGFMSGMHFGYSPKVGIVHERSFRLEKNSVRITDRITGREDGKCDIYIAFNFDSEVSVVKGAEQISLSRGGVILDMKYSSAELVDYREEECLISKGYGQIQTSRRIVFGVGQKVQRVDMEIQKRMS